VGIYRLWCRRAQHTAPKHGAGAAHAKRPRGRIAAGLGLGAANAANDAAFAGYNIKSNVPKLRLLPRSRRPGHRRRGKVPRRASGHFCGKALHRLSLGTPSRTAAKTRVRHGKGTTSTGL